MAKDYYEICAFPKPKKKKKKRKTNGWKDKPNRFCYYTGKPYAERHEVFFGSGLRQISIDYGFQVDLCRELHKEVHSETERGQSITNYWRKYYQIYKQAGNGVTVDVVKAIGEKLREQEND